MDSLNRNLNAKSTEEDDDERKPVTFYQGLLTSIIPNQNIVILDKLTGSNQIPEKVEILYDALVICTGASYPSPWRDGLTECKSQEERQEECAAIREEIRSAKSVLVCGGGSTGVESACYIAEKYPDKRVGIS